MRGQPNPLAGYPESKPQPLAHTTCCVYSQYSAFISLITQNCHPSETEFYRAVTGKEREPERKEPYQLNLI
jgi:hypothetical protein